MAKSKFFTGKLYQRMSEDLQLAGMDTRTHDGYLRAVRQLADYTRRSPDKVSEFPPTRGPRPSWSTSSRSATVARC